MMTGLRPAAFGLLVTFASYSSSSAMASLPKCMDVANRLLKLGGYGEINDTLSSPTKTVFAGAGLEGVRNLYETAPDAHPDYRWVAALAKTPRADAAILRTRKAPDPDRETEIQRAIVSTVGEPPRERVTQVLLQGKRYGSKGFASTNVRFDDRCRIVEFVTEPQDLGEPTRQLHLSVKSCLPVFQLQAKLKREGKPPMPPKGTIFTFADVEKRLTEFRKILKKISNDEPVPTLVEALENSEKRSYLSVTNHLYWAKLNLCREFIDSLPDPTDALKRYKKVLMQDRRDGSKGGKGNSQRSGSGS